MANYDDDYEGIDFAADAAESFQDYRPRRNLFRFPTADEKLESSPYFIEGATDDDLVLSGAPPAISSSPTRPAKPS
jgi:hypothetical protein